MIILRTGQEGEPELKFTEITIMRMWSQLASTIRISLHYVALSFPGRRRNKNINREQERSPDIRVQEEKNEEEKKE